MWTGLETAAEMTQGMFSMLDVEEAMKASNFNKVLGPDGFEGTIFKLGNPSHRLTQEKQLRSLDFSTNP